MLAICYDFYKQMEAKDTAMPISSPAKVVTFLSFGTRKCRPSPLPSRRPQFVMQLVLNALDHDEYFSE